MYQNHQSFALPTARSIQTRHVHRRYLYIVFILKIPGLISSDFIRDPTISAGCFRRLLKTYLSLDTSAFSALEVPDGNRALLIYLLTYFTHFRLCQQFNHYRQFGESYHHAVCLQHSHILKQK